tara:strand:+ start:594 stop:701 length:108 start_codon:yes stop_codon:yes gene_type:complete
MQVQYGSKLVSKSFSQKMVSEINFKILAIQQLLLK